MRIANLAVSAVFVAFIVAPIGSALFSEHSAEVQDGEREPFIATRALVDEPYRDGLIRDAVLGSPVGVASLAAKAGLDYDIFGFADRKAMISGVDGWLFFKQGFENGRCQSPAYFNIAFDAVDMLQEIASAIGVDFKVSVPPDKEVVYPDKLGARAGALAGCNFQNAVFWRALAEKRGSPWLIDHLAVLRGAPEQVYFRSDTHWNDFGFALAYGQIARDYLGVSLPVPTPADATDSVKKTDLSRLVGRMTEEPTKSLETFRETQWPSRLTPGVPGASLIIHDSFFGGSEKELSYLFARPSFYRLKDETDTAKLRPLIGALPSHILFESVERFLFGRIQRLLKFSGAIGRPLLDANIAVAARCRFEEIEEDAPLQTAAITRSGGDWQITGQDPQVHIPMPRGKGSVCLRVSFDIGQDDFAEIFLANPREARPRFRASRSIPFPLPAGRATIAIVLPEASRGDVVRLDPVRGIQPLGDVRIEIGSLDPQRAAATKP